MLKNHFLFEVMFIKLDANLIVELLKSQKRNEQFKRFMATAQKDGKRKGKAMKKSQKGDRNGKDI